MTRAIRIIGAIAIGIALLLALAHAPPVRARVLAWALGALDAYRISGHAQQLDYNVLAGRLHVRGLALAVQGSAEPFFQADDIAITVGWSTLWGVWSVESIQIDHPKILYATSADGQSNWPEFASGGGSAGPGPSRSIGRFLVRDLELAWRDATAGAGVDIRAASLDLEPVAGRIAGPLVVGAASLRARGRSTAAQRLAGSLAYDGRSLEIPQLELALPEGRVGISGRVDALWSSPELSLDVEGASDVKALSSWLMNPPSMSGQVAVTGTIRGAADDPTAALTLTSDDVTWPALGRTTGEMRADVTRRAADVRSLTWRVAGGDIAGAARVSFGESPAPNSAAITWSDLDAARLIAAIAPGSDIRIASRLSGRLDARWPTGALERMTATLTSRAIAESTGRDVNGTAVIEVNGDDWRATLDHSIGNAVGVNGAASGRINFSNLAETTLGGRMSVAGDAGRGWDVLHAIGVVAADRGGQRVDGDVRADLDLSGTLGSPQVHALVDSSAVRVRDVGPAQVHAEMTVAPDRIDLSSLLVRVGPDASLRATGAMMLPGQNLDARVDWTVSDIAVVSRGLAPPYRPAGSISGEATLAGRLSAPILHSSTNGSRFVLLGQEIDRWSADVRVENRTVFVERLDVEQGDGRLTGRGEYEPGRSRYAVQLTGRQLRVDPIPGSDGRAPVPLQARIDVEFAGAGSLTDPHGNGQLTVSSMRWGDWQPGIVRADATIDRGALTLDARASDLSAGLRSSLTLVPFGTFTVDGAIDDGDIARLVAGILPSTVPLVGTIGVTAHADGAWSSIERATLTTELRRVSARLETTAIELERPSRIAYGARAVSVDGLSLRVGETNIRLDGRLEDRPSGSIRATVDGQLADLLAVARALESGASRPLAMDGSGRVALDLTIAGTLGRPSVDGRMNLMGGRLSGFDLPPVTNGSIDVTYKDGLFSVQRLDADWQDAHVTASGSVPARLLDTYLPRTYLSTLPPQPASATAVVRANPITPAVLAPFVSESVRMQLGGVVSAALSVEADALALERSRGELVLDRAEFTLGALPVRQQRPTRIAIDRGRARVVDWEWTGEAGEVTVGGSVDLTGDRALDLSVSGGLDLRVAGVYVPTLVTAGTARLGVTVRGTAQQPLLGGQIDIEDGEIRSSDPRLIVTDLTGSIDLSGDRISAANITGSANGGTIAMTADLRLAGQAIVGTVGLRGEGLAMDAPFGMRSEINGDLSMALSGDGLALSGQIDVLRGSYREPLSLAGGLLAALRQPSSVSLESPSRLDAMTLDVRLVTVDDLRVDNNYARLALGADLRLTGTLARPGLTGRATTREGGQIFLGGIAYRLAENGSIDFANPSRIEPDLDLMAVTRVRQYDVTLAIKGTPETLETTLTSDPALARADIVALLVTGRTLSEQPQGQPIVAGSDLLGVLSGEFGVAGRAVGLDVLRVERGVSDVSFDAGLVATETDPASRLTFGKQVTSQVDVVFSQSLRDSGGLTWIVGYAPRSNVEIRVVSHDNHDVTSDFRHDLSFGGRPPVRKDIERAPPRVSTVRFTGDGDEGVSRLHDEVSLTEGDRFDFFRWQDDRERLERYYQRAGFFEAHVRAKREEDNGATSPTVTLAYEITRGPRTTLTVEGFALPDAVRGELTAAWSRSLFNELLLEDMKAIVRRHLVSSGYLAADVRAEGTTSSDGGRSVVVRIDPGSRTSHREIVFAGNDRVATGALRALVKGQRLDRDAWTDPSRLRAAVLAFYRQQGMLGSAVRVDPPRLDGDRATLPVAISEGPVFTVGAVQITGVGASSLDDVRSAFDVREGEAFEQARVDQARDRVAVRYRSRGYNALKLDVVATAATETQQVRLEIVVDEGPRQVLRDVTIDGRERTRPELVSRTLNFEVGEPVDLTEWQQARRRLYDTGVFQSVDVEAEPIVSPAASGEQPVRARVRLDEWPAVRLRYGFDVGNVTTGLDTREFQAGLSADLTYRNLFGRAMSAGLALRYAPDVRAAREFVTMPTFLGRPITSTIFLSESHEETAEAGARPFVTDKIEVTAEQRFRPRRSVEVMYGYGFERNHTFQKTIDPGDLFPFDVTANIARLTSTVRFDSRDDLVDATRGWFHSSSFEYAPEFLGSDLRFVRYLFLVQHYRRLAPRLVFASDARLGLATGFEGQELIPSDRFFAGGGNSVRGYAADALSPHDAFGNPVGGDALLVFNEELRFPIAWRFRGVGFFDAGRAFPRVADLSFGDLRTSIGAGLRVETPFALLRVDFGVPVNRRPEERAGRWFFSIGQAF